jgi:hypothetical protein
MRTRPGLKYSLLLIACLALQIPAQSLAENAISSGLTPAQLLKPDDLTPKELDFYKKQSDPEITKNFIITRSYVRLCQKVIDKKMPAELLPDKPLGFSAHYLLAGEATMINQALSDSIVAMCKTNPKACFGNK